MDKNEKLKQLEARQREIADEIKALREPRTPQKGDVYTDDKGNFVLVTGAAYHVLEENHLSIGVGGVWGEDWGYLGSFEQVYVRKDLVCDLIFHVDECTEIALELMENVADDNYMDAYADALGDAKEATQALKL
jgi:hypothetical protein